MRKSDSSTGRQSYYDCVRNQPPSLPAVIDELKKETRKTGSLGSLGDLYRLAGRADEAFIDQERADHVSRFLINGGSVLFDYRDDRLYLDGQRAEEISRCCRERRAPSRFSLQDRAGIQARVDVLKDTDLLHCGLKELAAPPPYKAIEERVLYLLPGEAAFWLDIAARFGIDAAGRRCVDIGIGTDPRGFIERGLLAAQEISEGRARRYAIRGADPRSYRVVKIADRAPARVPQALLSLIRDLQNGEFSPAAAHARPEFEAWVRSRHPLLKPADVYEKLARRYRVILPCPDGRWLIGVSGFEASLLLAAKPAKRKPRGEKAMKSVKEPVSPPVSREVLRKRRAVSAKDSVEAMSTEMLVVRLDALRRQRAACDSQAEAMSAQPETARTRLMLDVLRKQAPALAAKIAEAQAELGRRTVRDQT